MNYRVRRQGENLGVFSLEELRRRREAGELAGGEYVQREGTSDWQPLDLVLQHGYRTAPPLPSAVSSGGPNYAVVLGIVALVVIFFGVVIALFVNAERKRLGAAVAVINRARNAASSGSEAVAVAGRPIIWATNTLTQADANRRARQFRIRQWLDGYETRGQKNPALDAEVEQFIRVWIARNYGGVGSNNPMSLAAESDRLAGNPACTDPLVLTVAANESASHSDSVSRFERALAVYPASQHRAYPQFNAMIMLASQSGNDSARARALSVPALQQFRLCFTDGSFTPDDQQEIAENFVNGWGRSFFSSNAPAVCQIVRAAGPDYRWLALVLDGERKIAAAWAARGGGYANTVTQQGWQDFNSHLQAARNDLTQAWNLSPGFPLAPSRMIYVSLGDSDITEMRTWFDRTLAAQVDYPRAWADFRWGLRPRWYGSEEGLLALGKAAVATGRFDTEVPRKFLDCVTDVESEEGVAAGLHIFGREDIWPDMQRMYEGYIAAPQQARSRDGWRTAFAVVAYFAGKYDVSRAQLEALDWKPVPADLAGWNADLSLLPLEVAARTGSQGGKISEAESAFNSGDMATALKRYNALDAVDADARTREFVQFRLAALTFEEKFSQHFQNGEWVDFLPSQIDDPNWIFGRGKIQQLGGGTLEIESAPNGHFLFCRTKLGAKFEVRGSFEIVHPSDRNFFQAGLLLGVPDIDNIDWYDFRIRRFEQGDFASIGRNWTKSEIFSRVALNSETNSFDFVFQNGKVTASVNGIEVFHQSAPPASISVPDNSFALGLGANTTASTVIRYRGVQVRKLN